MKNTLKPLFISLLLALVLIVGGAQKATATTGDCPYGTYHEYNTRSGVKVLINGQYINGTLYTCSCGSEVICTDVNKYCYPSSCTIDHSFGYPYLPGTFQWYVPSALYPGTPSNWTGIW
jgi:hypothetical protein